MGIVPSVFAAESALRCRTVENIRAVFHRHAFPRSDRAANISGRKRETPAPKIDCHFGNFSDSSIFPVTAPRPLLCADFLHRSLVAGRVGPRTPSRSLHRLAFFDAVPSRLTRYVLSEILKVFVVSLFTLTTLILLIGVARELIRRGLGAASVVQLLPFVLPISLQFAFPATALFSVCSVYGRMAADGEVSTVKSCGVSPLKLLGPALVFAFVLSPAAVMLSDLAVSWGRPGVNRVVMMSIEDIAYRVLDAQHSYTSEHGFSIHVRDVQDRLLVHPTVTLGGGGDQSVKLTAAEGELSLDPDRGTLLLRLKDSSVAGGDRFESIMPGDNEFPIPLQALAEKAPSERSPSELPLRLIADQTRFQREQTESKRAQLAATTGFALLGSRPADLSGPIGRTLEYELKSGSKRLRRLEIEPWRRWAWGFSCLCFVMVGAPLAMLVRSGDNWTTFGLCFLPTLVVYYPLFILGLEQAKDGNMPPQGVWLGNLVLVGISAVLCNKVRRH